LAGSDGGVHRVLLWLVGNALEQIERFGDQVTPLVLA
jgi:hypothetical protein